jgi:leader peptidase (prepilin peptidase)/N-methyltransferase
VLAVLAGGGFGAALLSALWLLIALAMSDAVWMRLPDGLTAAAAVLALLLAAQPAGIRLAAALWGAVLGAGSFAALRWGYFVLRGRMGLGLVDVKLMVGLGAFCGPLALPFGTALCFSAALLWLWRAVA